MTTTRRLANTQQASFTGGSNVRQTTLSVGLEVKPESHDHLCGLLDALRPESSSNPAGGDVSFDELAKAVPVLHFMSLSVFPGFDYDPLFVIEANFDGEPGPFWAQLEACYGPELRSFLRCCKRPLDQDGPLFDAVTATDSRVPIAPYFAACAEKPTVFHHGNRGMSRDRILAEFALFKGTRVALDAEDRAHRTLSPAGIHAKLREQLIGQFQWLDQPAPKRIQIGEDIADWLKLGAFIVTAILALSLPGLVLALVVPPGVYLLLVILGFVVLAAWLKRIAGPLPGTDTPTRFSLTGLLFGQLLPIAFFLALYLAIASAIATPLSVLLTGRSLALAWGDMLVWLALGFASVPTTITGILV